MLRQKLLNTTTHKLRSQEGGNTAVMFALTLVPIFMIAGFSLDYRSLANAKSHAQDAMDAGVLSATRTYTENYGENENKRKKLARDAGELAYLQNMDSSTKNVSWGAIDFQFNTDFTVTGTVKITTQTYLSALMGKNQLNANVLREAIAGDSRPFEIVLVLDNTTSMFEGTRMEDMREAAKAFTEIMYTSSPNPELTRISVIPTAALVNINVERPAQWDAAVDKNAKRPPAQNAAGSRKVPPPTFDDRSKYLLHPEDGSYLSKAKLEEIFTPVEWRGCVRAADNERKVSKSGFVQGKLNDTPVGNGLMRWPAAWLEPEKPTRWVNESPPPPPPPPPGVQGSLDDVWQGHGMGRIEQVSGSYFQGNVLRCNPSDVQHGYPGARNVYMPETSDCSDHGKKEKTGTLKACVSDPNEFECFASGGKACEWQEDIFPWNEAKPISGPQFNCPTAMLGLSESPKQVYDKLDHMYPVPGGTQIDVGLMWGLRALSPRKQWTNFFGYHAGSEPLPFNKSDQRKIMIVLTDGSNSAPYHYEGYYDTNRGNAWPCWQTGDTPDLYTDGLNNLTLDSCKAIRDDYGVEIFTVAVDVNSASAKKVLRDCAGDDSKAYDVTGADLASTFELLAMRSLRLTK